MLLTHGKKLLLLLLVATVVTWGQQDRATLTGMVIDPSGAIVPNVDVTVMKTDTGVQTQTKTNEAGLFTITNLPPGIYEVRAQAQGFKTYTRPAITLGVAQSLRLDVKLETGSVQESITVSADASLLSTDNAQISTTIQNKTVTDLPLSFAGGRAIENFAYALTPAVEGNNWTSFIAGTPAFSKEVMIDGMSATAQIQGHIGETSPTMEAVQEFNVQTSGLSAEYGRTSGAVFNFALKSGTNDLHGSAFYYGRNEALNANTWMNNWQLSQCAPGDSGCSDLYKRARDRQNLYGASLGGPLVIPKVYNGKNRTFLFGAFEQYQQEQYQMSQDYSTTVPIPDFLAGNFSKLLTGKLLGQDALGRDVYQGQIFDPTTLRKANGKWVSDPFLGNIIPSNRLSPMSVNIASIFTQHYAPKNGFLTNNSTMPLHNDPWFHQTQWTGKADHNLTANNRFSGSVIWTQRPRLLVDSGGIWDSTDRVGGPLARARWQEVQGRALRLSNNWTLSPTVVNTASFAFNRYINPSQSAQYGNDWNKTLGITDVTTSPMFPEIAFGNAVNGIGTTEIGYGSYGGYVGNTYIMGDNVVWIKGKHSFKFGGNYWKQQINSSGGIDNLSYTFDNAATGLPGASFANQVGFGFASFMLGQVAKASKNVPFNLYGRRNYIETYAQDDIKVTNRLTLNAGLRWEQARPFREKYGRWANFNPNIINTAYGVPGALEFPKSPGDSFERNIDWKEFSPRIGAAYRITDKMTARGGYGIFFIPIGINYWSGVPYGFAPGFRGTNNVNSTGNVPQFQWDQTHYLDSYAPPTQDPNTLIWGMVAIDPDSLYQAYTHQYNASFQYEVSKDLVVEAAFVGNQGRRLHDGAQKRNQPLPSAYQDPKVDPTAWIWDDASAAAAGVKMPYPGFSAYAGMALQPFPHVAAVTWGPVYYVGTNTGESAYRSLQFQVTKRMSHGLAAQASYNYSRATGNVESAFDETWDGNGGIQDMYNLAGANSVLSYDQTHVFKGYVQYELPFGKGKKYLTGGGWQEALFGGWSVSSIFHYNTGQPLGIYPNVWYPGWDGTIYANWNQNVSLDRKFNEAGFNPGVQNASANLYFDPSAFSNPTNHQLGNGQRLYDALRGFGWSNEDVGIIKYWHAKERLSIQLRAELLNVANRHHYANPNTSLGNTSTFGYVTGMSGDPRNMQFGLRVGW